jgi:hypothetical protein
VFDLKKRKVKWMCNKNGLFTQFSSFIENFMMTIKEYIKKYKSKDGKYCDIVDKIKHTDYYWSRRSEIPMYHVYHNMSLCYNASELQNRDWERTYIAGYNLQI